MADVREIFIAHYNRNIQLSLFQSNVIACTIESRQPGCRTLIFGVGNDTGLWLALGNGGDTYFLEASTEWLSTIQQQHPDVQASILPTFGLTVESSMGLAIENLNKFEIPSSLRDKRWDVILVDAPLGHKPKDPGRAVAISWASRLATKTTHVFVDDYDRPLEKHFADLLLRNGRENASTVIPASAKTLNRQMFWSIGAPF